MKKSTITLLLGMATVALDIIRPTMIGAEIAFGVGIIALIVSKGARSEGKSFKTSLGVIFAGIVVLMRSLYYLLLILG